ncbi:H-2 class II histocompatibility antigen, E-S beta chain-like [Thunnus albacares]|uniref:H-2 class II histocompatibility antigen, E-S beta chain-like n=1 Tax=Thunnus albacares TaxID=8236 RepID=UPI001CF67CA4|nr:H-2 class II histocompatibility antigen, E-S beta chain-like [Thunnus albacares]
MQCSNNLLRIKMYYLLFYTVRILSFFSPLCLLFSRVDAFYAHGLVRCQFASSDGHDAVYLEQIYFNKVFLAQYNSTLGKYVGYTEKAKEIADGLNKNEAFLKQERKNTESCKTSIPLLSDALLRAVEPTVKLRSVKTASSKHPGMLVCSVNDFYPKLIRVTWLRNGKEVTSDVTSTEELSNGNWLYQTHSYLEYTPINGETITCMVEHASLMEPKFYDWDPMPDSNRNKIAIGTAGLLVGLVFFIVGLICYYKRRTTGRVLVPTS